VKNGKPVFHAECGQDVPQGVIAVNISLYCDKATVAGFLNVIERKKLDSNYRHLLQPSEIASGNRQEHGSQRPAPAHRNVLPQRRRERNGR
jgi:hypothetical protein